MKIEAEEYYTFEEAVKLTMEELGCSRRKAIRMVEDGIKSGELPSTTIEELRRENKIN